MNRSPSIMSSGALNKTTEWFEKINNFIKGFGIIAGGLAASLADWLTGSIALSVLFSGVKLPVPSFVIGTIWSLGAWGVQLLLWEMILSGKAKKLFDDKNIGNYIAAAGAVILKFCDDAIDLLAIFYMMQNSTLKTVLTHNEFIGVTVVVYLLSWILVGFSEIFVSISIYMLRNDKSERTQPQPQRPKPQEYKPISRPDTNYARPATGYSRPKPIRMDDAIASMLPRSKE